MKKFLASFFVIVTVICFTACSSPMSGTSKVTNQLGCAFSSKALITMERLTAEADVTRMSDGIWEVVFSSPNTLSGVRLCFNEGNVAADYKGLSFSVPRSALPVKAMLLNLMDAVDKAARDEELKGTETDGMLRISGSLEGGDYTLTVDENGRLAAFEMPNNLLKMTFTDVTPFTVEIEEPTSAASTECETEVS